MPVSTSEITSYLDADEKVLWDGAPPSGIMFRYSDIFFVPFSFLWFGFALFWEASVLGLTFNTSHNPPVIFPLFGLVFVCVGAYMAIGRFFFDADVRGQTIYAITSRRAIIFSRAPFRRLKSVGLSSSIEISTDERRSGSGTIYFGARSNYPYSWGAWSGSNSTSEFKFESIPKVREVLKIIRQVQNSTK
jgi:hypothetical protein